MPTAVLPRTVLINGRRIDATVDRRGVGRVTVHVLSLREPWRPVWAAVANSGPLFDAASLDAAFYAAITAANRTEV